MNLNIGVFNLTADKHNVIVHERYEKESGGEGLRFNGYHGTVQAALRSLSATALKQSEAQAVNDILVAIERHEKAVEQLIASVDFNRYRVDLEEAQEDLDFLD